jgi:hypothetical protein
MAMELRMSLDLNDWIAWMEENLSNDERPRTSFNDMTMEEYRYWCAVVSRYKEERRG